MDQVLCTLFFCFASNILQVDKQTQRIGHKVISFSKEITVSGEEVIVQNHKMMQTLIILPIQKG